MQQKNIPGASLLKQGASLGILFALSFPLALSPLGNPFFSLVSSVLLLTLYSNAKLKIILLSTVSATILNLFWLPHGVFAFADENLGISFLVSCFAFFWLAIPFLVTAIVVAKIPPRLKIDRVYVTLTVYLFCYWLFDYPFRMPLVIGMLSFPSLFAFGGELFALTTLLLISATLIDSQLQLKQKLILCYFCLLPLSYFPEEKGSTNSYKVGLVQPATPMQTEINEKEQAKQSLQTLYQLTSRIVLDSPDLILWPESAVPYHSTKKLDTNYSKTFDALTGIYSQAIGASILYNELLETTTGQFNNMITLRTANGTKQYYAKQALFPLGETMPGLLRPLQQLFPNSSQFLAGMSGVSMQVPQKLRVKIDKAWQLKNMKALENPEGLPRREQNKNEGFSILPMLCFEGVSTELVKQSFLESKHPDLLVNLVNDNWFSFSWQRVQHAQLTRMRAAEHERPLVRLALGGKTEIYSDRGEPLESGFPLNRPFSKTFEIEIAKSSGISPYARHGLLPALCFLFCFFLLRTCVLRFDSQK